MHLLFLDESGQLSERRLFALGGVALRDSDWLALRDLWQTTLAAHAWPPEREVKWHGIRTGEVPPALADAVVSTLAHARLTCYVTLLDQELGLETAPEFFATEEDTYATGLMFLAERFQHLLVAEDDVGLIVVDSRFREEDSRLRRFFSDLTKDGTPYSRLDRIVEGLFLGPSHYSIGLQCADLVVAIAAAAERGQGQARGYLKALLPRFAVHPMTGELDGVGLKRFPEECGGLARRRSSSSRGKAVQSTALSGRAWRISFRHRLRSRPTGHAEDRCGRRYAQTMMRALACLLVVAAAGVALTLTASATPTACKPTLSDGAGPFQANAIATPRRAKIGTGHVLQGRVLSPSCAPVRRALVVFWQAGPNGYGPRGRGSVLTDRAGRFRFEGPLPASYGGAPHIHIAVLHPAYEDLLTRYVVRRGSKSGRITFVLTPLL